MLLQHVGISQTPGSQSQWEFGLPWETQTSSFGVFEWGSVQTQTGAKHGGGERCAEPSAAGCAAAGAMGFCICGYDFQGDFGVADAVPPATDAILGRAAGSSTQVGLAVGWPTEPPRYRWAQLHHGSSKGTTAAVSPPHRNWVARDPTGVSLLPQVTPLVPPVWGGRVPSIPPQPWRGPAPVRVQRAVF